MAAGMGDGIAVGATGSGRPVAEGPPGVGRFYIIYIAVLSAELAIAVRLHKGCPCRQYAPPQAADPRHHRYPAGDLRRAWLHRDHLCHPQGPRDVVRGTVPGHSSSCRQCVGEAHCSLSSTLCSPAGRAGARTSAS